MKTLYTVWVLTWERWSSEVYWWSHPSWGSTVRQDVDHCRGVVSGVPSGGVQLPFAVSHRLHLFITRLRTDTSAAAEVFPVGSCHRAPVVVCHWTGLIRVRVLTVHPVCTDRVMSQPETENTKIKHPTETYGHVLTYLCPAPHSPGRFRRRSEPLRCLVRR